MATTDEMPGWIAALATAVREGQRGAVARALNLVEDRRKGARSSIADLLRALANARPEGHRIGLTGPPGVGKSTLVGALAEAFAGLGCSVGVLAVDPSSRRSGGALLGDRMRIETRSNAHGPFVRSLATGGELGGLARAAPAAVLVLAAAFDRVLIETVGVGQSETDVEHVVDTVVLVVQPCSGDALQFFKAGIMEIPDVVAINKSDIGEAALATRRELEAALRAARGAAPMDGRSPAVVMVSAQAGDGVDALVAAVQRHRAIEHDAGTLVERRIRGQVQWGLREAQRIVGQEGIEREGGLAAVGARIAEQLRRGGGPL
jgi:LAO/AO transport system kinase